jgi:hypothetical protein
MLLNLRNGPWRYVPGNCVSRLRGQPQPAE